MLKSVLLLLPQQQLRVDPRPLFQVLLHDVRHAVDEHGVVVGGGAAGDLFSADL